MTGGVLVFVESNTSGTGRLFVHAARALGLRPVLVTARPDRYRYLSQPGPPEVLVIPAIEEEATYRLIYDRFDGGRALAGITTSSEYFVPTAAALASRFALPGPDPAAVRRARDKSWQRCALAAAGLPSPSFRVAASAVDARAAARVIGLPVVIKPLEGSGSVGVRACADVNEAEAHAAMLLSRNESRVLVEALIDGPEFSVELFAGKAIGITRKHLGAAPHFVEIGHDYPAVVSGDTARALTDTAASASAVLGLEWGPLHCELRVRDGQAFVMEVNPRLAGGFIPEIVRQASGIDLIRETLRLATGAALNLTPRWRRWASIRFLIPPRAGRLAGLEGIARASARPGVVDVAVYRNVGDDLTCLGDFRDRVGHVIACGYRPRAAASNAERARDAIRLRTEAATVSIIQEAAPCAP